MRHLEHTPSVYIQVQPLPHTVCTAAAVSHSSQASVSPHIKIKISILLNTPVDKIICPHRETLLSVLKSKQNILNYAVT